MATDTSRTPREAEQQRLGAFFALGGFPRVPPHDEPAACREAWLRGYDEAKSQGKSWAREMLNKQKTCDHSGYEFGKHGRVCPICGISMVDFGD